MVGELSIRPGSGACLCHWPELCDGTGWMECLDECACRCGGTRECSGCKACRPLGKLKAPFPWFGGKSRAADIVWERFGNVPNYVEPFFGSGAILLQRPHLPGIETVNDRDCMVANFWRALQHDPDTVAHYADSPVNEADQHARHLWLVSQEEFRERMKVDPDFYDTKIAGWWVWGQCIYIGSGWCSRQLPHLGNAGRGVNRQLPHLGDAGRGVNRQLPHLGNAGRGVNRQLPHLGDAGTGVHRKLPHLGNAGTGVECVSDPTSGTLPQKRPSLGTSGRGLGRHSALLDYMRELAERLRRVRVCCGDWSRICGPSPTVKLGITGVFLDPPYADEADRQSDLYSTDDLKVAHDVREWAVANGDNPQLRIALCGYSGEHQMPSSWEAVNWKARGGYGSQGDGRGRENATRERIWFSPHCLHQPTLFAMHSLENEPAPHSEEWMRALGSIDQLNEEAFLSRENI